MLVTGVVVYYLFPRQPGSVIINTKQNACSEKMNQRRLNDYKFTHPILLSDLPTENSELSGLKEKIIDIIAQDKNKNLLKDVSVYFRTMNDGSWFVINGDRTYAPASLMKVTFLIAILKQSEADSGLLDKKIYFEKHADTGYNQTIKSFKLEEKKYYTIRELLHYMIGYSDNDALALISRNTSQPVLKKFFEDLGVASPSWDPTKSSEYVVTVSDYCKLFRVLYNSCYLTNENSDLALEMLSESTYKGGLLKDISPSFQVVHKFGERFDGQSSELHEIGIFYSTPQPYLLGVMSEGQDMSQLSSVLGKISKVVYENYNKRIEPL